MVTGLALIFLVLHLPFMASTLADIDSVNLALGIHDFDPARHRPHPPGYPILIALGKLAALVLPDAQALAVWGVLFGALAAFGLWTLFGALERADTGAGGETRNGTGRAPLLEPSVAASAVTLSAPLVWLSASRPMTDVAGFGVVALAQGVLAAGLAAQNARAGGDAAAAQARAVRSGRLLLAGAFLSALAIGVRSQAVWLTLPLLAFVLVDRAGRAAAGALIGSAVWFVAGTLVWAVPLLVSSGGLTAYWAAFGTQAGEDWSDATILATHPSLRALAASLIDTFIRPWDSIAVGVAMLVLAAIGVFVLLRRGRKTLTALLAIAIPYTAFHLLFQETPHTRYAIPLVPVVAYLAVRALGAAGRWPLVIGTGAIVLVSMATTQSKLVAFWRAGSPSARLLTDLTERTAAGLSEPEPVLSLSHALSVAWRGEVLDLPALPVQAQRQWAVLADFWRDGNEHPVWYMTEPEPSGLDRWHSLAQIDPRARRIIASYRWPFDPTNLLGGVRPSELDWYELAPPGWMLLDGASLTPRLAGMAAVSGQALTRGGLRVLVRRQDRPVNVLLGGRNLARAGEPAVTFTLALDGADRASWAVDPSPGFFLRTWTWPGGIGTGPGPFAELSIRAEVVDAGGRSATAAVEQFDLQPAGSPILGFGDGWHEQEYDPARGVLWRWSSGRATLVTLGVLGDCVLKVRGEAPTRYFAGPSRVTVSAGRRVLFESAVAGDYDWAIPVPASALAESGGRVVLATDQTFRPVDRGQSADRRALGLRLLAVSLTPASSPGTAANSRTAGLRSGAPSTRPTALPTAGR
ncbi:MAG: DUF2723 domain-containing protein [Acidobacteriota bacterium]